MIVSYKDGLHLKHEEECLCIWHWISKHIKGVKRVVSQHKAGSLESERIESDIMEQHQETLNSPQIDSVHLH